MGRLASLLSYRATYQQALSTLKEPSAWLEDWFRGGRSTASGKTVNESTALKCGTIYACVDVYATSIASLPWNVQRKLPRGKERATEHALFDLLKYAPNPLMSSYVFRETLIGHVKTWGNAYARIERDARRRVVALWIMRPDWMSVKLVQGEKVYEYRKPGSVEPSEVYFADDIFHLTGLGFDGLVGYSPIRMAMETIGWSMATHEYGASFFGNSSRVAGILSHPGELRPEAATNLREQWEELRKGSANAHQTVVLQEGVTWTQIGIPQDEAQFIETMAFQVEDICRWYRMPPHKVQQLKQTFANIEQSQLSFYTDTLRPELVRLEQEADRQLLTREERRAGLFTEFLMDAVLRGDSATRHKNYSIGRQWGYYSSNDVREMETLNPIETPEGDDYHLPVNMVPLQDSSLAVRPTPTQGAPGDGNIQPGSDNQNGRAALRERLRRAAVPIFREALARVGRREADQVRKASRKFAGDRPGFVAWLREYYGGEFNEGFARDFAPVIESYAAQLIEADIEPSAVAAVVAAMADRHRSMSVDALTVGDVEAQLLEWSDSRATTSAESETVLAAAALGAGEIGAENG